MTEKDIETKLIEHLRAKSLETTPVSIDSRFREDLGFDSLDLVDMRTEMNIMYGVRIDLSAFREMKTIRDLAAYIINNK